MYPQWLTSLKNVYVVPSVPSGCDVLNDILA
eukprot:SAG11_NODE_217_length_12229_cov_9.152185_16_plen_31_part_00